MVKQRRAAAGRIASKDTSVGALRQRLSDAAGTGTPGERTIAAYLVANLHTIPFETAASLGEKIGVSEASIGRFCRTIGFRHLKNLKSSLQLDLGDRAWLIGDRLEDFHRRSRAGKTELSRALEREIAAIVEVYEMASSPAFEAMVRRLARARSVCVAGFQTERGHAAELAHNLQYLRPDVHLADVAGGHFAEILTGDLRGRTLVLIDGRRYSRLTRELALAAREAGIPTSLITDPYCTWAHDTVTECFAVQTDLNHFWDTTSAMSSLIGLVVNGVFRECGAQVEDRMARVSALYDRFIGHTGSSGAAKRKSRT